MKFPTFQVIKRCPIQYLLIFILNVELAAAIFSGLIISIYFWFLIIPLVIGWYLLVDNIQKKCEDINNSGYKYFDYALFMVMMLAIIADIIGISLTLILYYH